MVRLRINTKTSDSRFGLLVIVPWKEPLFWKKKKMSVCSKVCLICDVSCFSGHSKVLEFCISSVKEVSFLLQVSALWGSSQKWDETGGELKHVPSWLTSSRHVAVIDHGVENRCTFYSCELVIVINKTNANSGFLQFFVFPKVIRYLPLKHFKLSKTVSKNSDAVPELRRTGLFLKTASI